MTFFKVRIKPCTTKRRIYGVLAVKGEESRESFLICRGEMYCWDPYIEIYSILPWVQRALIVLTATGCPSLGSESLLSKKQ